MNSYRVVIKRAGEEPRHYVVREWFDLRVMLENIEQDIWEKSEDIESIKFVKIPDIEEV